MNIAESIRLGQDKLCQRFERVAARYHRTYLLCAILFAMIGYGFILLFPGLTLFSIYQLSQIVFVNEEISLISLLSWLVILLFCAQATYHLMTTRPVPAVGFTMPPSKIPEIYALLEKLQQHFKRPRIDRIIITSSYELDIVKTPRWLLPVWSTNTLVIGLPVLLCHTPAHFEQMLARRIGQFSKRHNMVTNWLYQLNAIWKQYAYIYSKQRYIESKLLQYFYKTYAYVYEWLSNPAARMDELQADSCAMELHYHEDICSMVTMDSIYRWYLEKRYWPASVKAAKQSSQSPKPFHKLTDVMRAQIQGDNLKRLKTIVMNYEPARKNRFPSLQQRLLNIGHDAPSDKINEQASAAEIYLGASLNGAMNLMDKHWLKKTLTKKNMAKKG